MNARRTRLASLALVLALAGCGSPPPAVDAGPDAALPDGAVACRTGGFGSMVFSHASIGVVPGTSRHSYIELTQDACTALDITFAASAPGIATTPTAVTIPLGESRARIDVTGVAVGTITLTATATDADGSTQTAEIEVAVTAPERPSCDGSASGTVTAGAAAVEVTSGLLDGSLVSLPAGAARADRYHVDGFSVAIGCDADQIPDGYVALGPAVSFDAGDTYRFQRELGLAIPIQLSLLPSQAHRGHVEVSYTGPGVTEPRVVGITSPVFVGSAGGGVMRFEAPRLGTYQAVVRADVPHMVSRRYAFRGIMGFSMGGSGSGRIGVGNPELFDFVAPLGGPTDWTYLLEYIRRYHIGGFCTEAERAAGADCSAASLDRAPARGELYEHTQTFENWWYEDGYDGQGGSFDREEYISIFRDLTAMFGNPNSDASEDPSEPNILPPGIPDSTRTMSDSARCEPAALAALTIAPEPTGGDANPATGFFDDEYNADGTYPVIAFCDGAQGTYDSAVGGPCTAATAPADCDTDVGLWNPDGEQRTPMEVALAVDVDGDGIRDPGEPVIRNGREPFDDFGCDGAPSTAETGYSAANPDPAGDDYDFQYNPTGTEGNWEFDDCGGGMIERFDDFGLDGVDGTPQLATGGFDHGEGNGLFDRAVGADRMISTSPRGLVRGYRGNDGAYHDGYPLSVIDGFDLYADGGVRDLFNWVVQGQHTIGGFAARGVPVRYYNGHSSLHMDGRAGFAFNEVLWEETGRYTLVRYGSIDATEADLIAGDGGHVGTPPQLLNRFFSSVGMMSSRWPDTDRSVQTDSICGEISPRCEHVNSIEMDFTAPTTGRTGPVTIVLPPGYFDPENADVRYPVVYFLHGYGMEPGDLTLLGGLMWNYMITGSIPAHRRVPKMIFVFPDGRCRNGECLRGTFYTDAPESTPNGAQMQTFLLDLNDYVDTTFRTRMPETFTVEQ